MNSVIRSASDAAAVALGLSAAAARATSIEIDQTGQLHSGSYLDNFYVGGYAGNTYTSGPLNGNLQYGPGPNTGFTFTSNANVESSGTNQGKFENLPTGDLDGNTQVLYFSALGGSTTTDTINFMYGPGGFNGITFNYSLDNNSSAYDDTATIWSGLNGTGTSLGTINLLASGNPVSCSTRLDAYCTWSAATSTNLSAAARSITFGAANGAASNIEFDAVTVSPVPLPGAALLLVSGLGGLGGLGGLVRRRQLRV
jgi:hypothetical protein